jgi:hypothetical protein
MLEIVDDGHLFLLSNPRRVARSIRVFLASAPKESAIRPV